MAACAGVDLAIRAQMAACAGVDLAIRARMAGVYDLG
jgi:hypothetical protein